MKFIENTVRYESRTDSRRKKLKWGENPVRDLTICNGYDATQSPIQEVFKWIHKLQEKNQPPNIDGRHQIICQNWKIIGKPITNNEDIQSRYRNGIWQKKMCHANNEKQKTANDAKNHHRHHHHVVPLVRISLTLPRHFSLSFIASGRSSGLHPVSSHSCWMYVRVVVLLLPGHMWGSIGAHHLWARPCFSSSVLQVWFV